MIVVSHSRPVVARSVLAAALERGGPVVVTDGGKPSLPPPPPSGIVVKVRPVVDAMKRVDGNRVVGPIDRAGMVEATLPVVLSAATARRVLAAGDEDPIDLAAAVAALGEPVLVSD